MDNLQYSGKQFHHQQSRMAGNGRLSAAKNMVYAAILVAGLGCANSVLAATTSGTTSVTTGTITQPFSPPDSFTAPLACTSPNFVKCDGTNDATCSRRCDAKLDSFPPATTRDGRPLHSGVSATGYKVYDIVCPPGYASGNPRVLAGAVNPQVIALNFSHFNYLKSIGYNCYNSGLDQYYVGNWYRTTLPVPGTDIDLNGQWSGYNIGWMSWSGDFSYVQRFLRVYSAVSAESYCSTSEQPYTQYIALGPATRCSGIVYRNKDVDGKVKSGSGDVWCTRNGDVNIYRGANCYSSCGNSADQVGFGPESCNQTTHIRIYVEGYQYICNAPFFPQGEPILQSVCIYSGPTWTSRPTSTKSSTTNCVPASSSTSKSSTSGPGVQDTGASTSKAGSSANICPPPATPKKYGPGSTVLPTTQ